MKTFRSKAGPLPERPYYKLSEIETICTDALRDEGLYPEKPEPIRIERFIEKRFHLRVDYRDLPDGLLGYTAFGPRGVQEVVVSRALVENGDRVAERQANSTLAHEAGHGLLQGHIIALAGDRVGTLFNSEVDPKKPAILCRDPRPQGARGYDGRWWEFQANQAIGALLLPKPFVIEALSGHLSTSGAFGRQNLPPERRERAVREVAQVFDVNPAVARIRLEDVFPEAESGQLTLYKILPIL
jgi:hypothetical protein